MNILDKINELVRLANISHENFMSAISQRDALLETLELIVGDYDIPENYDVKIYCSKSKMEKAKAAIAAARGK